MTPCRPRTGSWSKSTTASAVSWKSASPTGSIHLTLGQYEHCRIPVSAPVTPHWFIDFVLRNFYHTPSRRYADEMPPGGAAFDDSVSPAERRIVHVVIPKRET